MRLSNLGVPIAVPTDDLEDHARSIYPISFDYFSIRETEGRDDGALLALMSSPMTTALVLGVDKNIIFRTDRIPNFQISWRTSVDFIIAFVERNLLTPAPQQLDAGFV